MKIFFVFVFELLNNKLFITHSIYVFFLSYYCVYISTDFEISRVSFLLFIAMQNKMAILQWVIIISADTN